MEMVIVAAAAAAALSGAALARKFAGKREITVDGAQLVSEPAIVVFTAAHCSRCARVLEMVRDFGLPIVEYRAEADAETFAAQGVDAAPVTVVTGAGGASVAQFAGVPRRGSLARAVGRARNTAPEA